MRWIAVLGLIGLAACGPAERAAAPPEHVTTIDDLTEAQAINFVASASKPELTHNLSISQDYKFKSVAVVGNATCGEVNTKGNGGFSGYHKFFVLRGMATPILPSEEPNFDLFWSRYCAHAPDVRLVDGAGQPPSD